MRIAIIGTGNMGSWFAKELSVGHEIAVYNRTAEKAKLLANNLTRVKVLSDISEIASFEPNMIINAVSLQNTISAFEAMEKYIPKNCLICDVASIKAGVYEYYIKSNLKFASVHPMFGPTFANVVALSNENAIIIKESDPEGAKFFRKFFQKFRLNIFEFTFAEHDQMMAYSLTTPFVSTLVFAACVDKTAVPGTTFDRHMKIAKGLLSEDDHLLSEILFNRYSLKELEKVTARLEYLKHIIKNRDYEILKKFLDVVRKNVND